MLEGKKSKAKPAYTDKEHGQYYHSSATLPGSTKDKKKVRTLLYQDRLYRDYEMTMDKEGKIQNVTKSNRASLCDNIFSPHQTAEMRIKYERRMQKVYQLQDKIFDLEYGRNNEPNKAEKVAQLRKEQKALQEKAEAEFYGKDYAKAAKELYSAQEEIHKIEEYYNTLPPVVEATKKLNEIESKLYEVDNSIRRDPKVMELKEKQRAAEREYYSKDDNASRKAYLDADREYDALRSKLYKEQSAPLKKEQDKFQKIKAYHQVRSPTHYAKMEKLNAIVRSSEQTISKIVQVKSLENPVLSKDGQFVAGLVDYNHMEVFKIKESGECESVAQIPYQGSKVSFSYPEKDKLPLITFTGEGGGSFSYHRVAHIYDLNTKKDTVISKDNEDPYYPGFTKDGRVMYKASDRDMTILDPNQLKGNAENCIKVSEISSDENSSNKQSGSR